MAEMMILRAPILTAFSMFTMAGAMLAATPPIAGLIRIEGAIGPATSEFVDRAIEVATERGDACLIIELDTPGGLLDTTKKIVRSFYNSEVPIIVYVAPAPASAGSAGVFITMAAHVAAMAPHTSIGAAHPVSIGIGSGEKDDGVMKKKMENYATSFAESIAAKRHRNAEWAKSAVLESAAITAERALELNVIDLIATDIADLLRQAEGREIDGRTLQTANAQVTEISMTWGERFLQVFLRPEAMFILMLVVIYGIIGEMSNPGAILPGVAGAIALILVLYLGAILPVNVAGIALILLAVALFVLDLFTPSHGILTVGGVVAFFLGAIMLFKDAGPGFSLPLWYIIPGTLLTAAFFIFVVGAGLRAQFLPVRAGRETMIGQIVPALQRIDSTSGKVFVEGEYWNAVSDEVAEKDQPVEIIGIEGLTLKVKPKTK